MIYIYYGDDRAASEKAAKKILGETYEVVDAADLEPSNLPDIFLGTTLFETSRNILIKDLLTIKILAADLEKYLDTPHKIVLMEQSLDKRTAAIKSLTKNPAVKIAEFKLPEAKVDRFLAFNVYDEALRSGESAVKKLRAAESTENSYLMLGAWASKATKSFSERPNNPKTKRILKELARLDLLLKTSKFSENPWPVLELFLLNLKNL